MRQLSKIIFIFSILSAISILPALSAISGGIKYSIPIDYSKLSETELRERGKVYFYNAQKAQDGVINEDVTNALVVYSVLQNINPENVDYAIILGQIYEQLGKDRYAKGNYARAIGTDSSRPEGYFRYGEYYYKKQHYRKALKYYNEAYQKGYTTNYDLLYKVGDIYQKLGDYDSALKYLKKASVQSPNSELDNKIQKIEAMRPSSNEIDSTVGTENAE